MEPPESSDFNIFDDLRVRAVSAGVLLLLAVVCVSIGGVVFSSFVILAALLLMKEWEALTAKQMLIFRLAGYPYIIVPSACLIWLRGQIVPEDADFGFAVVASLIAVISATDMGAYFAGKRFGRHKLAPVISPNKTWEGLGGGCLAAILAGLVCSAYIHIPHSLFCAIWVSLFIALFAQGGDLFKSWIKRMAEVKDSGTLLPGHGGLLDRIDGYMFTAPLLALLVFAVRG